MKNKGILIVDDSSFMRDLLKRELINYGFSSVYEGENGEEAISMYTEHNPLIIIMDVDMPIKNGIDALREIININNDVKVLIVSEKNMREEALREGAVSFLRKPFQPAHLWREIDKIANTEYLNVSNEVFDINNSQDTNAEEELIPNVNELKLQPDDSLNLSDKQSRKKKEDIEISISPPRGAIFKTIKEC